MVQKIERYRLGIDIGGTFTDLSAVESTNGKRIDLKTPTVPSNPERGVANGISQLMEQGIRPEQIEYFVHGTTIALNALIQRSGSRVALLVTDGFRDILEQGRIKLPTPYDFYSHRPKPLVPREMVFTVKERTRHDGIEIPLFKEEIDRVVSEVLSHEIDGVAICLLHSYANPTHELALKKAIEEAAPHLFVSASAEVWPQMREYERAVATVINAYLRPVLSRYLNNLEKTLSEIGVNVRPYLTRSNGGIMTTNAAKNVPIETLLSGPASGVTGALGVGKAAGFPNMITLDMGGTSADVAVIEDGNIGYSREEQIGDFPLILPAIGISSIGAGGGSIAWLDKAGVLKVGPQSAGADPGPACYGQGGTKPTLSDAFLLCGYLNPTNFVGNTRLDAAAAEASMKTIAEPLGLSVKGAANAVIQVALANMYAELSAVLERKGLDPRDFALLGFGGAGAVVACQLAQEINIRQVLIPPSPGTLCALGALQADVMSDFIRTVNWKLSEAPSQKIQSSFDDLKTLALQWLKEEAPKVAQIQLRWFAEMRYIGQSYEIEVPVKDDWIIQHNVAELTKVFHAAHHRIFFHSDQEAPVEIVNLNVKAIGIMPETPAPELIPGKTTDPIPNGKRNIVINGVIQEALVFQRNEMKPGHRVTGPIIVEQSGSTSIIPAGWITEVDHQGNLIISREAVSNE
jgi:N-methylhydantoinase A